MSAFLSTFRLCIFSGQAVDKMDVGGRLVETVDKSKIILWISTKLSTVVFSDISKEKYSYPQIHSPYYYYYETNTIYTIYFCA